MTLLRYFRREQLPVLKPMPPHVKNLSLDINLLMFQMDAFREHKSPAVNNAPHIATRDKK